MVEHLKYAKGSSSLGDFIVATSDKGVVAFEFVDRGETGESLLGPRFPNTVIEEDPTALVAIVAQLRDLVDHPQQDPGLPLDMRGTPYELKVWSLLREIPPGSTQHYGAIAAAMGTPRDARDATKAIASNPLGLLVPCHRVVKKDGSLSGYRWGSKRKRALLDRERSHKA